jgi:hypothetical protein
LERMNDVANCYMGRGNDYRDASYRILHFTSNSFLSKAKNSTQHTRKKGDQMLGLFNRHMFSRFVMGILLPTFTLTSVCPGHAIGVQKDIGLNEAALILRLEKLVEKMIKSKEKGVDKIIGCLVDIKNEIELSF